MTKRWRTAAALLAAGIWISLSEFVRNELMFKGLWIEKYEELGLVFPSTTVNNALWGLWSFVLAGAVLFLSRKLSVVETVLSVWVTSFAMMWIVIGNLNVLPLGLLLYAVPLSLFEVIVATAICRAIAPPGNGGS